MSEFDLTYWRCRGRGDAFLGHFAPPTWAPHEEQTAYITAFNAFQEAQAVIE
jgi:hypothetical protein